MNGQISIPLGQKVKAWFGLKSFQIPMPTNLDYDDIREIRIFPEMAVFMPSLFIKHPALSLSQTIEKL